MNILLRITKRLLEELSDKKSVQALFFDFYFIKEQQIIFYKRPLQMFLYNCPTQLNAWSEIRSLLQHRRFNKCPRRIKIIYDISNDKNLGW